MLFAELNGSLGLDEYQVQTRQGIERHLHRWGLAHLTRTHHAMKAVGDRAKRMTEDVPPPMFQDRLESLRHVVRIERGETIICQVRQMRIRRRLGEALLAKP